MAVLRIVGIEADADARADEYLRPAVELQRLADELYQVARQLARLLGSLQRLHHHHEFVAPEARQGVVLPHPAAETPRQRHQQRIAGRMAEAVIDVLEAVYIEEQHRQTVLVAIGNGDRMLQAVEQQNPVG